METIDSLYTSMKNNREDEVLGIALHHRSYMVMADPRMRWGITIAPSPRFRRFVCESAWQHVMIASEHQSGE